MIKNERRAIFIYIYTHSHLTSRLSHQTTDRIQSALVTVVNRKHCLIRYHGISLNNVIVTTVYWWVLEKWCIWCLNRTQSISSSVLWQSVSYLYVNYDDPYYKSLLHIHTVCVHECLNPYKERKLKQAGCGGARGEQAGSPALQWHISTAWRFCECMHTWASMFTNMCRENQRVL